MQTYNLTVLKNSDFRGWGFDTVTENDEVFYTYEDSIKAAARLTLKYLKKIYPEDFVKFSLEASKYHSADSESYEVFILNRFDNKGKIEFYNEHSDPDSEMGVFIMIIYGEISPVTMNREVLYRIEIVQGFKDDVIIGYKAFDENMRCYGGFQYEIGKEYSIKELPIICFRGFHFCKKRIHCFNYYDSSTAIICKVEASGNISRVGNKFCTNNIKILERVEPDDYYKE